MNEKTLYKLSLALPIVVPAICLLITPKNLDSLPRTVSDILLTFMFSGLVGGIPYAIFAFSMLIWMWNKKLSEIRKVLLFAPLLLIPIFMVMALAGNELAIYSKVSVRAAFTIYLYYFLVFSAYILAIGYFYVLITFGLVRVIRRRPFNNAQ